MIIVEVYVPSLDKTYDFKLNENVLTSIIVDEISAVICQKEQCAITGKDNGFMLFDKENENILSMENSLFENRIKTGSVLIFA